MKKILCLVLLVCSFAFSVETFDSWVEEPTLFGFSPVSEVMIKPASAQRYMAIDTVNVTDGDFSMVFTSPKKNTFKVGLTAGKYIDSWKLSHRYNLKMRLMTSKAFENAVIEIVDIDGNIAKILVSTSEMEWRKIKLSLKNFDGINSLNLSKVKAVQLIVDIDKGDKIWFDGVCFTSGAGEVIGVTDKPIAQRMVEAEATKEARRDKAFADVAKSGGFKILLNGRFAKLWLNQDVDQVNAELLDIFTTDDEEIKKQYDIESHWALFLVSMLHRLYFNFGSNSEIFPGRLYPETENALLELMWKRTKNKNDIYLTKLNTWWMEGSENHDLNAKVADLLSSQIFMHEPDFMNRVYPNTGKGGGDAYWFHQMYADSKKFGPSGLANWRGKDKKQYKPKDHYKAWVSYMKEYIDERAKKGFFVEQSAPGYMKYTISFINDIYDYCEDEDLKESAKDFLDLFWADWALEQINGVRGGGRTRDHSGVGGVDALYQYSKFFLGGESTANHAHFTSVFTEYKFPQTVLEFALGKQQLGSYEYITRKPGEANNDWPATPGTERTIMCDFPSKFLHYSWVTPDYIIGTQMDHPGAVHCHLSPSNRSQGIIFNTSPTERIYPRDLHQNEDGSWKIYKNAFYRSVQRKDVLITQQAKEWFSRHPTWFPSPPKPYNLPFGVYIPKSIERVAEKDGWIFLKNANSFVAVYVMHCPGTGDSSVENWDKSYHSGDTMEEPRAIGYEWVGDELIKCKNNFDTIIFETSSVSKHGTMEKFMADVLDNELRAIKTVVPGYYITEYTGCDGDVFNFNSASLQIPTINGELIDYAPKDVISSPYMNSKYDSGKIYIDRFDEKSNLRF